MEEVVKCGNCIYWWQSIEDAYTGTCGENAHECKHDEGCVLGESR